MSLCDLALSGLLKSHRSVRLVNPERINPESADIADISEMLLFSRYRYVRPVNPESADISEMLLSKRFRFVRLVACSSPVILLIFKPSAKRMFRVAISERNVPGATT